MPAIHGEGVALDLAQDPAASIQHGAPSLSFVCPCGCPSGEPELHGETSGSAQARGGSPAWAKPSCSPRSLAQGHTAACQGPPRWSGRALTLAGTTNATTATISGDTWFRGR